MDGIVKISEELNNDLNKREKVEAPLDETSSERRSGFCSTPGNPGVSKDGESGIRESAGLDSVAHYANRIRAFIGLEDESGDAVEKEGQDDLNRQLELVPRLDDGMNDQINKVSSVDVSPSESADCNEDINEIDTTDECKNSFECPENGCSVNNGRSEDLDVSSVGNGHSNGSKISDCNQCVTDLLDKNIETNLEVEVNDCSCAIDDNDKIEDITKKVDDTSRTDEIPVLVYNVNDLNINEIQVCDAIESNLNNYLIKDCVINQDIPKDEEENIIIGDFPKEGIDNLIKISNYQDDGQVFSKYQAAIENEPSVEENLAEQSPCTFLTPSDSLDISHLNENLNKENVPIKDNSSCLTDKRDEVSLVEEEAPCIKHIRKLSLEIVNNVLDKAENSLQNKLKEPRRLKTDLHEINSIHDESEKNQITSKFTEDLINIDSHSLKRMNDNKSSEMNTSQQSLVSEINLKDVLSKTYDSKDFKKKIETEMNKFHPECDVDPDTICGIGSFKPQWIQGWATAKIYLVLYSIIGILSGSYYSYLIGTISTLEKRFAFKSKISGSIMIMDEITPLFLGTLIGYFGGRAHRPRMVAFGMMLSSICCFISALPYFIYGAATHLNSMSLENEPEFDKCESDKTIEDCDADSRPPTLAAILFLLLGSFLKGFGNLAYYAVGLVYMDDNAKKKNTPIYFAFAFALRLLGPLVGFLMSYSFLKFYENPFVDPGFGPKDPRWIGGWWMGFVLQGVLLAILSAPLALFPRRLPGHTVPGRRSKVDDNIGIFSNFTGMFAALKRLARSPVFTLLILNTIMSIYGSFGHYIMLPKYMENQFRLSASQASLLSGPPGIAALIVSTLIGGYLIYRLKPNARILTGGMAVMEIIGAGAFLLLTVHQCEEIRMTSYGWDGQGLILGGQCNTNCSCSTKAFTPICAPDGKTHFFSPCFAGCQGKINETYTNCSCIEDFHNQSKGNATEGFCLNERCWTQTLAYIIQMPIVSFIVNIFRVAHTMVLLRSIKTEDKSVALGTFEALLSAFGFIPYPVVFGALVDSACLVWEHSCGKTGNCWFYDISKFNYLLHGSSALFTTLAALCMLGVCFFSGRVHDLYEEDEEIDEKTKSEEVAEKTSNNTVTTKF